MSKQDFLCSGDLVTLNSFCGHLAVSSIESEPGYVAPTKFCSIQVYERTNNEVKSKRGDDGDFYRRCMFRIELVDFTADSDAENPIKFGAIVQLFTATENYVLWGGRASSASSSKPYNINGNGSGKFEFQLRWAEMVPPSSLEAQWVVSSKYKLRQNGENVRDRDYIVLRNAQDSSQRLVLLNHADVMSTRKIDAGLRVDIRQKMRSARGKLLLYGDYVHLRHIERQCSLLCRGVGATSWSEHSPFARLGLLARDNLLFGNTDSAGVFFRPTGFGTGTATVSGSGDQDDDPTNSSSGTQGLDMWQLLPPPPADHAQGPKLPHASLDPIVATGGAYSNLSALPQCMFLLRHVYSGLYLSIDICESQSTFSSAKEPLPNAISQRSLSPSRDGAGITSSRTRLLRVADASCLFQLHAVDIKEHELTSTVTTTATAISGPQHSKTHIRAPSFDSVVMINSAKIDFNHNSQPQPQQQPPVEILEIFEQQEVLLWHCGSGVFLRPADEQVVALKQFQTKRDARLLRQLYTHGAWENCNDMPVVTMRQYHIGEAVKLHRVPKSAVRDLLALQRVPPLLRSACSALQLCGGEHEALAPHMPLLHRVTSSVNAFAAWLQYKEVLDFEGAPVAAPVMPESAKTGLSVLGLGNKTTKAQSLPPPPQSQSQIMSRKNESAKILDEASDRDEEETGPNWIEDEVVSPRSPMRDDGNNTVRSKPMRKQRGSLGGAFLSFLFSQPSQAQSTMRRPLDASRQSESIRFTVRTRQLMASNTRLLDLVLQLVHCIFLQLRAREALMAKRNEALSQSLKGRPHVPAMVDLEQGQSQSKPHTIPLRRELTELLLQCASSLLLCTGACVQNNATICMRLLSCPDVVTAWVQMTLFGWQPPVATLLECASRFQQRLEQGGVKNFTVVDPAEMYLVIAQLIRLHRAGYESSAVALGLVTHLFTASEHFKTRQMDDPMYSILQISTYEDHAQYIASGGEPKCLWFRSFCSAPPTITLLPECGQLEDYPAELRNSNLMSELGDLLEFLRLYLPPGGAEVTLPLAKAVEMLEDLGIGGQALMEETLYITDKSLGALVRWWWARNRNFLPCPLFVINQKTLDEIFDILESNGDLSKDDRREPEKYTVMQRMKVEARISSYLESQLKIRLGSLSESVRLGDGDLPGTGGIALTLRLGNVLSPGGGSARQLRGRMAIEENESGRLPREQNLDIVIEEEEADSDREEADDDYFRKDLVRELERQKTLAQSSKGVGLGLVPDTTTQQFDEDEEELETGAAMALRTMTSRAPLDSGEGETKSEALLYDMSSSRVMLNEETPPQSKPPTITPRSRWAGAIKSVSIENIAVTSPRSTDRVATSPTLTWEVVFSTSDKHQRSSRWLRQGLLNLNSICDPANPYVQRLITELLPAHLLLGLLASKTVRLRYKSLIVELLSKGYLRRNGVFPCYVMTSYGGKFFLGEDDYVPGSVPPVSDVFNDATSPYTAEEGMRLRRHLRALMHQSMTKMSFSIVGDKHLLQYNTALLRLLREMLLRGFFTCTRPSRRELMLSPEYAEPLEMTASSIGGFFANPTAAFDSPDDIQDMVVRRLVLMDPPRISDTHYDLDIGRPFVDMIDAVVEVLRETVSINQLQRIELYAKLTARQKKLGRMGPVVLPDRTLEERKLTQAMLALFSAVPLYLDAACEAVQKKVLEMMFAQVTEKGINEDKLKQACVFPYANTAVRTRQLAGMGLFLSTDVRYLCETLKQSKDERLKRHLYHECRLTFERVGGVLATFSLISRPVAVPNKWSQTQSEKHMAAEQSVKEDAMGKATGGTETWDQATLLDLEQYSNHAHYPIDDYVETYFLLSFVSELAQYLHSWTPVWPSPNKPPNVRMLDKANKEVGNKILEFIASCGYSSREVCERVFPDLRRFVLLYWEDDYCVSLLLEQFLVHKCEFSSDEVRLVIFKVLEIMNVQEPDIEPIDIQWIIGPTHRLLPILIAAVNFVELSEDPTPPASTGQGVGYAVMSLMSPSARSQYLNDPDGDVEDDLDRTLMSMSPQSELVEQLLFTVKRLAETVEGDGEGVEREVPYSTALFVFAFKLVWAFLNNHRISQSLRDELRASMQTQWPQRLLTMLIRRRDCPTNVRVLLLKVSFSLHTAVDYPLIDRCLLKHGLSPQEQLQLAREEKDFGKQARRADTEITDPAALLGLTVMPSLPTLMDYLEDSLFLVGKSLLFHFILMYENVKERPLSVVGRDKEIVARMDVLSKEFCRTKGISPADISFQFDSKDTKQFFRTYEYFEDFRKDAAILSRDFIPAVFAVCTFCDFLRLRFDTRVGYNRHVHSVIAARASWVAILAEKMIEDYEEKDKRVEDYFSPLQWEYLGKVKIRVRDNVNAFFGWTLLSSQYTKALSERHRGSGAVLQPPIDAARDGHQRHLESLMCPPDAKYAMQLYEARQPLLFSEVYRIVDRLSRRLAVTDSKKKSEIEKVNQENAQLLRQPENLAVSSLLRHLTVLASASSASYTTLEIFNAIFAEFDSQLTASSHVYELSRLHRMQNALTALGGAEAATSLINRFATQDRQLNEEDDEEAAMDAAGTVVSTRVGMEPSRDWQADIVALCIQLLCNLMYEGNKRVQDAVLLLAGFDVRTKVYSRTGPSLIRSVSSALRRSLPSSLEHTLRLEQQETISRFYRFCAVTAQQHEEAQHFLRDQRRPEAVSLVSECAVSLDFLLRYLSLKMVSRVAPPLHAARARVAFNYTAEFVKPITAVFSTAPGAESVATLLDTIASGFVALKGLCQGPCAPNQLAASPVLREVPGLLDAIGTYLSDVRNRRTKDPRQTNDYLDLLNSKRLWQAVLNAELSVMRFLLSLTEGASQDRILQVGNRLDESILFDNLHRANLSMREGPKSRRLQAKYVAVAYLSLLLKVADAQEIVDTSTTRSENIKAWQDRCAEAGQDTSSFIASVEIKDKSGQPDRVYFAVPEFAKGYWSYPEVQRAKDEVMFEVVRTSPEEKMADFYSQMERLISVMSRQRLLATGLTPVLHTFFGGQSPLPPAVNSYVPTQRMVLLALSVGLNGFFAYYNYNADYGASNNPSAEGFFSKDFWSNLILHWPEVSVIFCIRVLHLALCILQVIRKFLNSRALDGSAVPLDDESSKTVQLFVFIGKNLFLAPITLLRVIWSCWWTCAMCVFSVSGLLFYPALYAPCMLDAVIQIRYMNFLVTAIKVNVVRIFITMMLVLLLLYQYAVFTHFFFPSEYNINGFYGCSQTVLGCWKLHLDYGISSPLSWQSWQSRYHNGTNSSSMILYSDDELGQQHPIGNTGGYIDPYFAPFYQNLSPFWAHQASMVLGSVYNFFFVVVMNFVLLAIISGYIIDTFGSMRDANEAIEQDKRNRCFVCSLKREEFERNGISFTKHVKDEHNAWKYLWFRLHLEAADPKTLTGPEYHSLPRFADSLRFVSLMPILQSISLNRKRAGVGEDSSDNEGNKRKADGTK